jgi:hypothetical protein
MSEPLSDDSRGTLKSLRQGLLGLHKTLLDQEKVAYERARGQIGNSYEFLQLVMKDPWFDWLHRLSELIVQIDEAMDQKEPVATEEDARGLRSRARDLLSPSEEGTQFQKNYFLALQQSPDVVLLHSEIMKQLKNDL